MQPDDHAFAKAPELVLPPETGQALQYLQLHDKEYDGNLPADHETHPGVRITVDPYYGTKKERLVNGTWGVKVGDNPMVLIRGHYAEDAALHGEARVSEKVDGARRERRANGYELEEAGVALAALAAAAAPVLAEERAAAAAREQARLEAQARTTLLGRVMDRLMGIAS